MKHLILLLFSLSSLCALEIANVSYARLFLLHPQMRNYHFGMHNFFREDIEFGLIPAEIERLLKDINQLDKDYRNLNEKARKDLTRDQQEVTRRFGGNATSDWQARREMNELMSENEYNFGEGFKQRKAEYHERLKNRLLQVFVDDQTRLRKLRTISSEIRARIYAVSKTEGLDLVVRSQEKLNFSRPDNVYENLDTVQLVIQLQVGREVFLSNFLQKGRLDLDKIKTLHSRSDIVTIMKNNVAEKDMHSYLKRHLEQSHYAPSYHDMKDITSKVLKELLKSNGFGDEQFLFLADKL